MAYLDFQIDIVVYFLDANGQFYMHLMRKKAFISKFDGGKVLLVICLQNYKCDLSHMECVLLHNGPSECLTHIPLMLNYEGYLIFPLLTMGVTARYATMSSSICGYLLGLLKFALRIVYGVTIFIIIRTYGMPLWLGKFIR